MGGDAELVLNQVEFTIIIIFDPVHRPPSYGKLECSYP
jgi:hypothetical protein